MGKPPSRWEASQILARGILRDREARRRMLFRMGLGMLGMVAMGQWGIARWLEASVWRFLVFWGACAMVTLGVIVLALYDALRVFREIQDEESKD